MVLTKDTEPVWDKPVEVSTEWIEFVDGSVMTSKPLHFVNLVITRRPRRFIYVELPQGSRILSISSCGSSYWTQTAQIKTEQADGTQSSFFIKVCVFPCILQALKTDCISSKGNPE